MKGMRVKKVMQNGRRKRDIQGENINNSSQHFCPCYTVTCRSSAVWHSTLDNTATCAVGELHEVGMVRMKNRRPWATRHVQKGDGKDHALFTSSSLTIESWSRRVRPTPPPRPSPCLFSTRSALGKVAEGGDGYETRLVITE